MLYRYNPPNSPAWNQIQRMAIKSVIPALVALSASGVGAGVSSLWNRSKTTPSISQVVKRVTQRGSMKFQTEELKTSFGAIGNAIINDSINAKIVQGDDSWDRDSQSIFIKSVRIRGTLASADANNVIRIVLGIVDSNYAWAFTIDSSINKTKQDASDDIKKVLLDRTITMTPQNAAEIVYKRIDIRIKINKRFKYSSTTGDPKPTRLLLGMISDSSAVAHPSFINGTYEIAFKDIH